MTSLETMKLCLRAIEEGWSFDRIDNEVGPALRKAIANEALELMADNARELGLDYDPVGYRITGKLGEICSFTSGFDVNKGDVVYLKEKKGKSS